MADITKRVQKRAAELLEPDERVVAALLVEPKGTYGLGAAAIAALPRTSTRWLAARAEGEAPLGLASWFPSRSCVVAATDRRVVAIPSNGVSMEAIAASYERADVSVTENSGRGLGRRLVLSFVDGTSVTVDAQRGQPFDEFTALVGS